MAERSDSKFIVKLGGLRSQLEAPLLFSDIGELWYNKTDCLWKTIYIYVYVCVYIYVCIHAYVLYVLSLMAKNHFI